MFPLTCFSLDLHPAHPFTHSNKRVIIFLQALICLLVQSRKGPELCPIEFLTLGVKHHAKGGHDAVEIGLLAAGPSDEREEKKQVRRSFHV